MIFTSNKYKIIPKLHKTVMHFRNTYFVILNKRILKNESLIAKIT